MIPLLECQSQLLSSQLYLAVQVHLVPRLMVVCYTRQKIKNNFVFELSKHQGFEVAI